MKTNLTSVYANLVNRLILCKGFLVYTMNITMCCKITQQKKLKI